MMQVPSVLSSRSRRFVLCTSLFLSLYVYLLLFHPMRSFAGSVSDVSSANASGADTAAAPSISSPALRTAERRQRPLGWYYDIDTGDWFYELSEDGTKRKTGWHQDTDGYQYYLDPADGHMHAGYSTIGGVEYCFLPERNRGNYHQNSSGAWYYRANGRTPYGAWIPSDRKSHGGGSGNTDMRWTEYSGDAENMKKEEEKKDDGAVKPAPEIVTDRIIIPAASPSEIEKPKDEDMEEDRKPEESRPATPSEIPDQKPEHQDPQPDRPEHSEGKASPSEIETPEPEQPGDSASPSEIPTPEPVEPTPEPEDTHIHAHGDDRTVPCIARDSWDTIRRQPAQYHDCIENQCTALLYLSGDAIDFPFPSEEDGTKQYPCYVSLIDDAEGLLFAQAYALPALSEVPMHIGLNPHGAAGHFIQTNQDGLPETWLFQFLGGTDAGDPFIFYLEKEGEYTGYSYDYRGYQLTDPATSEALPTEKMKKYLSRGFDSENHVVERTYYKTRYLQRGNITEDRLPQLTGATAALWLPAEQEVTEYGLDDAKDGVPYGMYLKTDQYLSALAASWRSEEAYWLRTLPSAYHTEDEFDAMGLSDPAMRNRYFLTADPDGTIRTARYDDTAALRFMFRLGG